MSKFSERALAPHVLAAISGGAQPKTLPEASKGRAAHVQAAISLGSARAGGQGFIFQPYGWAIHDSQSKDDPKIVTQNLKSAKVNYTGFSEEIDPEKIDRKQTIAISKVLHIHAHGSPHGVGGFSAKSLAKQVFLKFGNSVCGKTILLHSCEVGSGTFLTEFLTAIRGVVTANSEGTRVFGPERFLVVSEAGLSQVSKAGVKEQTLSTRKGQQGNVEKKGVAWRGAEVKNGKVIAISDTNRIKEAVIVAMK